MARTMQTIYEYLSEYSEKEIDEIVGELSTEERIVIFHRYGQNLHEPITSKEWNKEKSGLFYGRIIPKIKRLLEKKRNIGENETIEHTVVIEEEENVLSENNNENVVVETPASENVTQTQTLLQLLKEGKNNRDICEILNINNQELYNLLLNLKNMGITHSRKYYSDGSIKYENVSTMPELKNYKNNQDRTIITPINSNNLKLLCISDLHFGNELERLDLIDRAYNYCVKNGINNILCGGDLVDGSFTAGNQKITNLYQQIEYFITNYPYDKNILTFSVAGDHDISVFQKLALNLIEMCNNYRHDIIIGGYNNMAVNLKNDKVHLYHHIDGGEIRQTGAPIILHGHSHKFSTEIKDNILNVTIPTLSEINQMMPSALELNLHFKNGYITNVIIKHLYFGEIDIVLSESAFDLTSRDFIQSDILRNVESFDLNSGSGLKRGISRRHTQIERFNKRYPEIK